MFSRIGLTRRAKQGHDVIVAARGMEEYLRQLLHALRRRGLGARPRERSCLLPGADLRRRARERRMTSGLSTKFCGSYRAATVTQMRLARDQAG